MRKIFPQTNSTVFVVGHYNVFPPFAYDLYEFVYDFPIVRPYYALRPKDETFARSRIYGRQKPRAENTPRRKRIIRHVFSFFSPSLTIANTGSSPIRFVIARNTMLFVVARGRNASFGCTRTHVLFLYVYIKKKHDGRRLRAK